MGLPLCSFLLQARLGPGEISGGEIFIVAQEATALRKFTKKFINGLEKLKDLCSSRTRNFC